MIRLLYFSTASSIVTPTVVNAIAAEASRFNDGIFVTGALAFNGTNFAQVLEGDEAVVSPLMDSIRSDVRHTDVQEILRRPVRVRTFEGWGMRLVDGLEFDTLIESMAN